MWTQKANFVKPHSKTINGDMNRPPKNEYDPMYQRYVDLVDEGEFNLILSTKIHGNECQNLFA